MAGLTTFLTMAYILAINPNILSETGMDKGALFSTTVLISAASTIMMGLYAKLHQSIRQPIQLKKSRGMKLKTTRGCLKTRHPLFVCS